MTMMKPLVIDPGKYRRPVNILQLVSNAWVDVFGGSVVRAAVTPKGASPEHPEQRSYDLAMRYRPDTAITAGMVMLDGRRLYYIRSVADVEERHAEWQMKGLEYVLDQTASIQRDANLATAGADANWQTTTASVACALATPQGSYQQKLAETIADQAAWIVSFPIYPTPTDVRVKDHVVVSGLTLTVQHLLFPQSYPTVYQALASVLRAQ